MTTWVEDVDATLARLRERLDPIDRPPACVPRSDHDLVNAMTGLAPGAAVQQTLAPAAVLAPLVRRNGVLHVVFTERAAHLKRHAGQVSLPGGRMDPGDRDLAAAAVREAHEEIGLDPANVELLGAFDAYETVTGYAITPFVGLVHDDDFTPAPDPREVADVFEAPFAFVADPANRSRRSRWWRGEERWFYEIAFGSRCIWGATAGLLKALSDRLYDGPR